MKYLNLLLFAIIIFSCKKESDIIDSNINDFIKLSTDTIMFNNVFTTTVENDVSPTRYFKIYNNNDFDITIDAIYLNMQNTSPYRLNVDGEPGHMIKNTLLRQKDSLYIFTNVISEPQVNNEFILEDEIIFSYNGAKLAVKLLATAQNACYYSGIPDYQQDLINYSTNCGAGKIDSIPYCESRFFNCEDENFPDELKQEYFKYFSISQNTNWDNIKPHIIMGNLIIENGAILTINPGAKIHLHNNAWIIVDSLSTIIADGGKEEESRIWIQSHRSDNHSIIDYDITPGQWGRIWMSPGSKGNLFNWTIIKNGKVGLHIDGVNEIDQLGNNPLLTISNSIIYNMSNIGILAQGSMVNAYNLLVFNCGTSLLNLNFGGKYDFRHCTFANFWPFSSRQTPNIFINNKYEDENGDIQGRDLKKAFFGNCIIEGNREREIIFDKLNSDEYDYNYEFKNCLIKLENEYWDEWKNYNSVNNILSTEKTFVDAEIFDFYLDTNSQALNNGSLEIIMSNNSLNCDLENRGRTSDSGPDIGCFELDGTGCLY
ncbi:MAG: hypothetical protein CMP65_04880 [Flavobacteriales bacterium]|nr:hypothetical protein [Flavobacteriales bacterium]|tara:strand:+ start:585 stop:2210 length:1626 start_codon:yes stop_codon:yes gene_type:complete